MVREAKSKDSDSIPKVSSKSNVSKQSRKLKTAVKQLVTQAPRDSLKRSSIASTGNNESPKKSSSDSTNKGKKHVGPTRTVPTTSKNSSRSEVLLPSATCSTEDEEGMEWQVWTDKIINYNSALFMMHSFQPSESEVIQSLHELRKGVSAQSVAKINIPSRHQKISEARSKTSAALHVVVDTNIFLSHLPIVESLVAENSLADKVQWCVPWMVLQELVKKSLFKYPSKYLNFYYFLGLYEDKKWEQSKVGIASQEGGGFHPWSVQREEQSFFPDSESRRVQELHQSSARRKRRWQNSTMVSFNPEGKPKRWLSSPLV